MRHVIVLPAALVIALAASVGNVPAFSEPPTVSVNPQREAYYGDLHLHTSYSLDAYLYGGAAVGPDDAYRFAKGDVVNYLGDSTRRREPLDFLAVTDHSENIGVFNELEDPNSAVSKSELGKAVRVLLNSITASDGRRDFTRFESGSLAEQMNVLFRDYLSGDGNKLPSALQPVSAAAWQREIDFANRNYEPGKFTTFIAYEWTAIPYGANLHRNVIFKGSVAPYPFSSQESKEPKDLWNWLEKIRKNGYEALAIPHNGNASNGLMYDWVDAGYHMDRAYAEERQANEPLSEISQNKGASETHPLLSPNDEFADYEIYDFMERDRLQVGRLQGSYLRDALSAGLVLQRQLGANPFKYGFVGASDLHSGLSVSSQSDYTGSLWAGNVGSGKPTKAEVSRDFASGGNINGGLVLKTTSGNLTGVWAESNTRESIYAALRRRETFATTGTKLRFRLFGAWDFPADLFGRKEWVTTAYAKGAPMGGDLPAMPAQARGPTFAIWAVKDPNAGNLDRAQIIKVWEENGQQKERVFDVVWAGRRKPDPTTGKLPALGNTVDLTTGLYTNQIGAAELKAVWIDPDFDSHHYAAYYLRVLEIPTPRWSTLMAIKAGVPLPPNVPATIQQRGWSSPIWFSPRSNVGPGR